MILKGLAEVIAAATAATEVAVADKARYEAEKSASADALTAATAQIEALKLQLVDIPATAEQVAALELTIATLSDAVGAIMPEPTPAPAV